VYSQFKNLVSVSFIIDYSFPQPEKLKQTTSFEPTTRPVFADPAKTK